VEWSKSVSAYLLRMRMILIYYPSGRAYMKLTIIDWHDYCFIGVSLYFTMWDECKVR